MVRAAALAKDWKERNTESTAPSCHQQQDISEFWSANPTSNMCSWSFQFLAGIEQQLCPTGPLSTCSRPINTKARKPKLSDDRLTKLQRQTQIGKCTFLSAPDIELKLPTVLNRMALADRLIKVWSQSRWPKYIAIISCGFCFQAKKAPGTHKISNS